MKTREVLHAALCEAIGSHLFPFPEKAADKVIDALEAHFDRREQIDAMLAEWAAALAEIRAVIAKLPTP